MPITTKTGDDGITGIFTGERVAKFSPIIEANGSIDELSSFLGEAKHYVDEDLKKLLEELQIELYSLMADIGSKGEYKKIGEKDIARLEELIKKFESEIELKGFVIPGSTIGSDVVTVIEDPTVPNSWGFYLYDDEGVKARPRYLIKNGIINEFLMNREYAAYLGMKSNASARAINYNREPIVRMANTYLAPGDYTFEELIEDIKLGVYMVSFNEWNIDDRRFQQRYIGREAYLIENGEIKHPVRKPILEITTKGLWSSIDAVGKDIEFYPGTCGKGEPGQGVPVWMGGPHARLREVVLRR